MSTNKKEIDRDFIHDVAEEVILDIDERLKENCKITNDKLDRLIEILEKII